MAHPDLDELLNTLLPLAQQLLKKQGEYFPFGALMKTDGTIAMAAGYTGDEHPPSQDVIDMLQGGFRESAARGEVRAVGICLDVRVTRPGTSNKTDAVCMRLEHSNGESVAVYVPYTKGWFGTYKYGDTFAQQDTRRIFG